MERIEHFKHTLAWETRLGAHSIPEEGGAYFAIAVQSTRICEVSLGGRPLTKGQMSTLAAVLSINTKIKKALRA